MGANALLEHLLFTGISIIEASDGYHWSVDNTTLQGHRTTAIHAVGAAIYQLRSLEAQPRADLLAAQATIQHLENQFAAAQERENILCE